MSTNELFPIVKFSILGPVSATLGEEPLPLGGPRQLAVLARLLRSPRRVLSMDQLSTDIWNDETPAQPHIAIRSYISNLRKVLEPHRKNRHAPSCFVSIAPGYRLEVADQAIDWVQFEQLLGKGRAAFRAENLKLAVKHIQTALRLWRGEPCAGIPETETLLAFRNRLGEQRLAATELLFDAQIQLGEHKKVTEEIETLIAKNPLREKLTELGMLALYQSGRQSDALTLANQLRDKLLEQLGIDPGIPIQELEVKILNQDETLQPAAITPNDVIVPPSLEKIQLEEKTPPPIQQTNTERLSTRQAELSEVQLMAQQLLGGKGSYYAITGENGIGKTTFIEELLDSLSADQYHLALGRCLSGDTTWLWPWAEALGQLLENANENLLQEAVHTNPAIASIAPQFKKYLPKEELSLPSKAHTFASITGLVKSMTQEKPVLLVIEDLHLGDRDSVELFTYLTRRLAKEPCSLIGTWRDTELFSAPAAGEIKDLTTSKNLKNMELKPFTAADVQPLLSKNFASFAAEIVSYCSGNPYFIQEIIKSLELQEEPNLESLQLTNRCINLVVRRIQKLHPKALDALTTATLLSKAIDIELLARVTNLSEEDLVKQIIIPAFKNGLLAEKKEELFFTNALFLNALDQNQLGIEKTQRKKQIQRVLETSQTSNFTKVVVA